MPCTAAGSIPQEVLINLANKACDRLILGQTLTSDTSKDGGSYSLGKVHQGIRVEVIAHAAQYVANVRNAQLVPAIVALNYGHDAPTPELQFTIPGSEGSMPRRRQRWQRWQKLKARIRPNMKRKTNLQPPPCVAVK